MLDKQSVLERVSEVDSTVTEFSVEGVSKSFDHGISETTIDNAYCGICTHGVRRPLLILTFYGQCNTFDYGSA
jgi:hypothetical protein